ncbi:MAG: PfkB family carbohydrate kinase, partial [Propionibacteriaceae bacterium]
LVTLGGSGALLSCAEGDWFASPPPTVVKSTVGAGDSSLAGYLLALEAGQSPADCLRAAVAHGSAAAGLPGSGVPSPSDLHVEQVAVRRLDLAHEGNME